MLWICVKYFVHDYMSIIIKTDVTMPRNHPLLLLLLFSLYLSILGKPGRCKKYGLFQCNNGKCISVSSICNFRNDCGDNSDESKTDGPFCGRCAWFDFGYPKWMMCRPTKIILFKITCLEYSFRCNSLLKIISSGIFGKKSNKTVKSYHLSFQEHFKVRKRF